MGMGIAVLALAVGMAAAASAPANAVSAPHDAAALRAAAGQASTATTTLAGSIVYIFQNNVWVMAPDGTGKKQITTDGTSLSPYFSPTEADNGTVVAVRDSATGDVGTIYVMNRAGHLVNRFTPAQYAWHGVGESCSADYQVAPTGIQRATVSPDGVHVAYTASAMFQGIGCGSAVNVYSSYVVAATGSAAVHLTDIENIDSSEVGGWAGNATILLSNLAFGATKIYTVSVPG
jgi:hypothetical protein